MSAPSAADAGSPNAASAAYKTIKEGTTIMTYPADQESTVFYNPVQVQNRDLSVLMIALYAERRAKKRCLQQQKKKLKREQELTGNDLQQALDDYERQLDAAQLIEEQDVSTDGLTILESLAASGLRSIRYWKEIPGVKHVCINDLDPAAVERAHDNLNVNELKDVVTTERDKHGIRVQCGDATHEMYLSRRPPRLQEYSAPQKQQHDQYDVIDLDPYGSAAPFIDAAVQAVVDGGMLCVTCTDMAALGGSHPETAYGRYACIPIPRAKYLQELALRILLHTLATTAARYGRTIRPVLSVGMAFYVRVFVEVHDDKAGVNALSLKVGSVYQSTQCPSFHVVPAGQTSKKNSNVYQPFKTQIHQCEETGSSFKIGGPMWLGPLHDLDVVDEALQRLESKVPVVPDMAYIATKDRLHGLLTSVSEELPDVPLYYTLPDLAHTLRCEMPPLKQFKAALVNAEYRVSGYHKEPQAVKTDAPNRVVWDIMRSWCKEHPPKEKSKKKRKKKGEQQAQQHEEVSKKILAVEPIIQADFTIPRNIQQQRKATRFPQNPESNWGPKPRASGQKRKAEESALQPTE